MFRYSYWLLCNLYGNYAYHNFTVRISHNYDDTWLENFILMENSRVCDRHEILKLPISFQYLGDKRMQKWQGRQQARIKSCLKWVQIVHSLSSLSTFHEEFSSSFKKILTQMEMSCCSVAIKLGVQPYIFAVHLKTFRVGVYRVLMFSLSVFFVTFLETYSCYI